MGMGIAGAVAAGLVAGLVGAVLGAASIGCIYLVVVLWKLPVERTLSWPTLYPRLMIMCAAMPIGCTLLVALRAMLASGPVRAGWIVGDVLGLVFAIGWWWYQRRTARNTPKG